MRRCLLAGVLTAGLACPQAPARAFTLDDVMIELDDMEFEAELRHDELMDRLDEMELGRAYIPAPPHSRPRQPSRGFDGHGFRPDPTGVIQWPR